MPSSSTACKCDGIESSGLFTSQTATITSYGRVDGIDTNAIVKDQEFFLAEGNNTVVRIIGRSGPISSIVVPSINPATVRYQSKWLFTLPQLTPGVDYRIWSEINCQPKLQALNNTQTSKNVLAESTSQKQPKSIFQILIDFVNSLFRKQAPRTSSQEGIGTGIILEDPQSTGSPVQIKTVYPVRVDQAYDSDKSCNFLKLRVGEPTP